jgi:hypothetical protein
VTSLAATLGAVLAAIPSGRRVALVGGVAISARTEPRFTRDLDFAIAVTDDADAEQFVHALRGGGFAVVTIVEQLKTRRLATVRLRQSARAPLVDLLFASCGIEPEIVDAATSLEVLGNATPVAAIGHLIAMKLLSRDDQARPRDHQDLVSLAAVADDVEWRRAAAATALIEARGFARGRDLGDALRQLRAAGTG